VECKLRCVNFRRVSDPRRALLPAFRVTGISDDWYRSTMGVTVIGLGTPRSAGENIGCIWAHQRHAWERRGQSWEHLRVPATSLGAPRITVEQSGKTTFSLGTLLVCLEIIATAYRSTIFKTHLFSLYSHLCIYIATHLHRVYRDWLQAVLESDLRCAGK